MLQTLVLTGFAGKLRQRFDGHAIPPMNGRSCLSAAIHLSSRSVPGFNIGARVSRRGRQVSRVLCDFQFCVTACGRRRRRLCAQAENFACFGDGGDPPAKLVNDAHGLLH